MAAALSTAKLDAQQPLPTASADALLRRVDNHYNHLASMRTQYVERYTGMGMTRTESGTLLLKKPGRMRWSYDKPAGKVFLFDGKYAWFYTPGDRQVQRVPARQMDDLHTPLRFLLGHTELQKELDRIQVTLNGTQLSISGVPKGTQRLQRITLQVTPQGEITAMQIVETGDAETSFTFTGTEENVRTSDTDFRFAVPPGVTVIDGPPPI